MTANQGDPEDTPRDLGVTGKASGSSTLLGRGGWLYPSLLVMGLLANATAEGVGGQRRRAHSSPWSCFSGPLGSGHGFCHSPQQLSRPSPHPSHRRHAPEIHPKLLHNPRLQAHPTPFAPAPGAVSLLSHQACSCPRAFAWAIPSAWLVLYPLLRGALVNCALSSPQALTITPLSNRSNYPHIFVC